MLIERASLGELIGAVFDVEEPQVRDAYSPNDREPRTYTSDFILTEHVSTSLCDPRSFCGFAIRYPSCAGRFEVERINLAPEACNGSTFRYSIGGWGVFRLQFELRNAPFIGCRIAVNSHKRALTWQSTYHEWLPVEAWDWKAVEKHERRLMRKLRAISKRDMNPPGLSMDDSSMIL